MRPKFGAIKKKNREFQISQRIPNKNRSCQKRNHCSLSDFSGIVVGLLMVTVVNFLLFHLLAFELTNIIFVFVAPLVVKCSVFHQ